MESTDSLTDGKSKLQIGDTIHEKNESVQDAPQTESSNLEAKVTKPRSIVWNHFIKTEVGDKAKCMHCSTLITCRSRLGPSTSAMLNHMKRCKAITPEVEDENRGSKRLKQTTMFSQWQSGSDVTSTHSFLTFDQDACRKSIARWVIIDEVPFRTVEREGYVDMMHTCQPRLVLPSRRSLVRDCIGIYENAKSKVARFFRNYRHSVCLTTDLWTSRQNLSYLSLTAHFIDDDWHLHKKIINFSQIYGHTGYVIGKKVDDCLSAWKIEKVFTITVDNASSNDVGVRYIKDRLKKFGGVCLDGEFFHMRCGAHILNLIVKDGLAEVKDSIERIRSAIVYVRSSSQRTQKFKQFMEKQKINTNAAVQLDVETRWNSTYSMLESALRCKDAFDMLEVEDKKYRDEMRRNGKEPPSEEDWLYARGFLPFLKCFYEATVKISGSKYATGNLYMKEIFRVAYNINMMGSNPDEAIRLMASKMKKKFFKYWGDWRTVNPMIYLATVLDPRHKMQWVSFMIHRVYEEQEAKALVSWIETTLKRVFGHYESLSMCTNVASCSNPSSSSQSSSTIIDDFDSMLQRDFKSFRAIKDQGIVKNELDKYLTDEIEDNEDVNFDILYWWKTTGSKYKTISLMARDLLAIPVSTVASESAFSTGGRVIDPFRSSLTPKLVEALICAQDWIRKGTKPIGDEEPFEEIEDLEIAWESNLLDLQV